MNTFLGPKSSLSYIDFQRTTSLQARSYGERGHATHAFNGEIISVTIYSKTQLREILKFLYISPVH